MQFSIFDCRQGLMLLVSAALLSGCVSETAETHKNRETVIMRPATQPAQGPQAILYRRIGGVAGTDDRVVIWPDGFVTVRGKLFAEGSVRLNEADLAKMQAMMQNFSNLRDEYFAGGTDAYQITISYGEKSVTASDLSPQLPEEFRKIYTAIEAIAAQVTANPPAPAP